MNSPTSGLNGIKTIEDLDISGQHTFIRLDLNVPLKNGRITDETRIVAALPTLRYALSKKAKIIICSHLGRPKAAKNSTEMRREFSLEPIGQRLSELLEVEVQLVDDPSSNAPQLLLAGLKSNQVILLENIRFDKGEEENCEALASSIASYVDVYINDAFGASHRAHSTMVALPKIISQKGIGFLVKKEIEMLDIVLKTPKRPFVVVMGGAKVSDKIGLIENLMESVDTFIIGGAMAFTFLKAQGRPVGLSRVENDKVGFARELMGRLEARNKKLLLPMDHIACSKIEATADKPTVDVIAEDMMGADIGPKTIEVFTKEIAKAGTLFWNGPMGVFEVKGFERGSFALAEAISLITAGGGISIIGGGDTAAAVNLSGFSEKMSHISTGGGASLEYLQGDKLPGLEALRVQRRGL